MVLSYESVLVVAILSHKVINLNRYL